MQISAHVKADILQPSEVIETLLTSRGITDIDSFLHPTSPLHLSLKDFGYEKEWQNILPILIDVRKANRPVVVYTDYDADGITGGTVLWETLYLLGFQVMPYVPHRSLEGYGFSRIGIDAVKKNFDPALIISVDHGITAVDQITYAKSIGIPVIVTDHHHKQEKIPDAAEGIFHIPQLSGSGVAYMFAKQIFMYFREHIAEFGIDIEHIEKLKKNFETEYAAIASIGTIADLVPLVGPSRSLVKYGLSQFSKVKRPGVDCLIQSAGLRGKEIGTYEIGFMIAPRINAVGRLEHAIDALRLLCTTSQERASTLAARIGELNTDRQELVKKAVAEAKEAVELLRNEKGDLPKIIILSSPHWHEGIIGLIASQMVEEYYRPTIVMNESEDLYKGSARSISSFHITDYFAQMKELFINFGGHAQAGGFSLLANNITLLREKGMEIASNIITDDHLVRRLEVDLEVPLHAVSLKLAREIDTLQPFGIGNPRPSFVSEVELEDAKIMGKTGEHLKMIVRDPEKKSAMLEIVAFKKAKLFESLEKGMRLRVAYQLDINRWNGKETLQGKLLGIE